MQIKPFMKSGRVMVACGKCDGSGIVYFPGGSGTCFRCEGARTERTKFTSLAAYTAHVATIRASFAAQAEIDRATEATEERAYLTAANAIEAGIEAARAYWTTIKADRLALTCFVGALRDAGHGDEANAVVRDAARRRVF